MKTDQIVSLRYHLKILLVQAQVTSSDALKNSPWILVASSPSGSTVTFLANEDYVKTYPSTGQAPPVNVLKIPKTVVGFIEAGHYQVTEKMPHMPMVRVDRIKWVARRSVHVL